MAKDDKKKKEKKKAGTIKIRDDCHAPNKSMYLYYTGKNPFSLTGKIWSNFQPFFKISSAGHCEEVFKWDYAGQKWEFFVQWWVDKKLSAYSGMNFKIIVQGDEDKDTHEGRFTMEITPVVEHKFPSGWFSRGLWWVYHYIYYAARRREFIIRCRQLSDGYREFMKREMGMAETPSRYYETYDE